jgi:hypothetical protein
MNKLLLSPDAVLMVLAGVMIILLIITGIKFIIIPTTMFDSYVEVASGAVKCELIEQKNKEVKWECKRVKK